MHGMCGSFAYVRLEVLQSHPNPPPKRLTFEKLAFHKICKTETHQKTSLRSMGWIQGIHRIDGMHGMGGSLAPVGL